MEPGLLLPHDIRQTFVHDRLTKSENVATVSRMAGHEYTNTTKRFDCLPGKVMQEAVEQLNMPYPED